MKNKMPTRNDIKPEHGGLLAEKIELGNEAMALIEEFLEAFPPLDKDSEFHDDPVSGSDVIDWWNQSGVSDLVREIRINREKRGAK